MSFSRKDRQGSSDDGGGGGGLTQTKVDERVRALALLQTSVSRVASQTELDALTLSGRVVVARVTAAFGTYAVDDILLRDSANSVWEKVGNVADMIPGVPYVKSSTVGGTADAITLTPTPAVAAYKDGLQWTFFIKTKNTGAVTVAVSGLAARPLRKLDGSAFAAGELKAGRLVTITYDSSRTRFVADVESVPEAVTDTHYTLTKAASVSDIPSNPTESDIVRFTATITANIPSNFKDRDGSTVTAVEPSDEFRYDGTDWLKIGDGVGSGMASAASVEIERLAVFDETIANYVGDRVVRYTGDVDIIEGEASAALISKIADTGYGARATVFGTKSTDKAIFERKTVGNVDHALRIYINASYTNTYQFLTSSTPNRVQILATSGQTWAQLKTALDAITAFTNAYTLTLEGDIATQTISLTPNSDANDIKFIGGDAAADRHIDIQKAGLYDISAYVDISATFSTGNARNRLYLELYEVSSGTEYILARGQANYIRYNEGAELRLECRIPLLATDVLRLKIKDAYADYFKELGGRGVQPYNIDNGHIDFTRVNTATVTAAASARQIDEIGAAAGG